MHLTLSGYSTALFSTWYFVEELGLLLDCGDGLMSNLLQKSRKINHVFISHADRDHLAGLLQFNQLNARDGFPFIHYPKDSGSFAALADFSRNFDPHVKGTIWTPIADKQKIWIRKDIYVQAIRNHHVPCADDVQKSLGFRVVQVKSKLKAHLLSRAPEQIRNAIAANDPADVYDTVETILLAYSGDSPCENFEYWNGAKTLIHEATFLGREEDAAIKTHGNRHSMLADVIRAASSIQLDHLVLGHFSSRYSDEEIDSAIQQNCQEYGLEIPVFRLLPGKAMNDILNGKPVNYA